MSDLRQRNTNDFQSEKNNSKGRKVNILSERRDSKNRYLLGLAILAVVVAFIVLVPSPIEPVNYQYSSPPEWVGNLELNNKLQKAKLVYKDQIQGPESLVHKAGAIYTGTADGKIVKLHGDNIVETVAMLGKPPCGSFEQEPTCGRPLGLRFDKNGYLLVIDAYLGIFKVNVETGEFHHLISGDNTIEGYPTKFLNDLDMDEDKGIIYFTDTSYQFQRRMGRYQFMEATPKGRVFSYNLKTGKIEVLLDKIYNANGIQLSPKKDYLLIISSIKCQILKYYLEGNRKGQSEIFAENLPGTPDNIRLSESEDGYWIGIGAVRTPNGFSILDFLAPRAWLRSLIFKIIGQDFFLKFFPSHGLVIKLNEDGEIVQSLHDPGAKTIRGVSEVMEVNNTLYLGSFSAPYIGKLVLD